MRSLMGVGPKAYLNCVGQGGVGVPGCEGLQGQRQHFQAGQQRTWPYTRAALEPGMGLPVALSTCGRG